MVPALSPSNRVASRGQPSLDGIRGKVQVGDGAHQRGTEHAEAYAEAVQRATIELLARESRFPDVEDHDVGLHPLCVDLDTGDPGQSPRQRAGRGATGLVAQGMGRPCRMISSPARQCTEKAT